MAGSRSIRSFRCADTLWRSLEDEADEREVTIDTLIIEALWSYLREAPEFSSVSDVRTRPGRSEVKETPLDEGTAPMFGASSHGESDDDDLPTGIMRNPKIARPVRKGEPRRSVMFEEIQPTADNLQIVRDAEGHLLDPATGQIVDTMREELEAGNERVVSETRPNLALFFSGSRYPVQADRFLIGRSSKGTDLQIRDANVSRKHAAVIFHDGGWFVHDLQSTNGVEHNGRRIRSRRIEPDDRYTICDYELVCELEGG